MLNDWLNSLDTDTLVWLFTAFIFAPFIIWAILAHRASKREEPQREAKRQADFNQRAAELGMSPGQLRQYVQGMTPGEALETLTTNRERFLQSRGMLAANTFGSFTPCRPGRRPFTNAGVYGKCVVVVLTFVVAYVLGELYDASAYAAGVSVDDRGGAIMAVLIPLALLGILSGALLNDDHGWWLRHPALMAGIGLCMPACLGLLSSMVPLRGMEDHYSVLHIGYADVEVFGQYFGWLLLGLVTMLVLVVPPIRRSALRGKPAYSDERAVPSWAFVLEAVALCFLPALLVYVVNGGDSILAIVICLVGAVVAIRALFNVYDLCDWSEGQRFDGVYEWPAALLICMLATFGVFSAGEGAEKAERRRQGR